MPPPCGAGWWGRRHRGHRSLTAGGGHSRPCIAVPGLRRAVCKPISRKVPRSSRAEPEAAEATRSHALPPARFLSSANLRGCSHQACMTLWGPANSGNTERAENCRKGTLARLPAGSPCLPRSAGWDRLWRMARREFRMTGKESRLERGLRAAPAPPRGARTGEGGGRGAEEPKPPDLALHPGPGTRRRPVRSDLAVGALSPRPLRGAGQRSGTPVSAWRTRKCLARNACHTDDSEILYIVSPSRRRHQRDEPPRR